MSILRALSVCVVLFSLAAVIALVPSVPFGFEPMIEINAPELNQREVTLAQYNFRKDIVIQYFSWAVLSMTLAGFVLVQFSSDIERLRSRYLIIASISASILSVLVGVIQLEVLAELLQQQTLPTSWIGPMSALPATQLGLLAFAALAAFLALTLCVFGSRNTMRT